MAQGGARGRGGRGARPAGAVDIPRAVAAGDIAPVYALHGAERYLLDRAVAAIRGAVLDPRTAGFNHDVFELKESGLGPVLGAARTAPMMAKRRLVIGKGLHEIKADELEKLLPYIADPAPSAVLVLIGDKVDTRYRAFLGLRKAGFLHDFKPVADRDLPTFIQAEARQRGAGINPDAARLLAEIAGADLGRLAQAVEQLALYTAEGNLIGIDEVETMVAETRQRNVFELTRAIAAGDRPAALRTLTNMLRNRQAPLQIQFMLVRQVRQIWRAKELMEARTPRGEIAAAIGVPPFFLDEVLGPARRMSAAVLGRSIERLYRADRAFKSSRNDPEVLLSRLVDNLVRDAAGAS